MLGSVSVTAPRALRVWVRRIGGRRLPFWSMNDSSTQVSIGSLSCEASGIYRAGSGNGLTGVSLFRACLEEVAADDGVDAVLAVAVPTAFSDLSAAVAEAVVSKPLAVALLDRAESVRRLKRRPVAQPPGLHADTGPAAAVIDEAAAAITGVPCYADPGNAARALGHAARYQAWRGRQRGTVPDLEGLRAAGARTLVTSFLAGSPDGGWLPEASAAELVSCYGIPLAATMTAADEQEATAAAAQLGGLELMIGVTQEPVFGPLVVFGSGGAATEVHGDHVTRLTPLTDADAKEMVDAVHAAPLSAGGRGTPSVATAALADVLLRVSRLADDLPEVSELDLNPVIARQDGVWCVAVRVQISPAQPKDPFLRRLL